MYGIKLVKAQEPTEIRDIVVTSGTTITKNDPVYLNNGALSLAVGAGYMIDGIAQETVTGNGTLTCKVYMVKEGDIWKIDNDNKCIVVNKSSLINGESLRQFAMTTLKKALSYLQRLTEKTLLSTNREAIVRTV